MEPRGILTLGTHKWTTATGENAAQLLTGEVVSSMAGYGDTISELERSVRSMTGQQVSDSVLHLRELGDRIVRKQGYTLDIGVQLEALKGSRIYIPGYKAMGLAGGMESKGGRGVKGIAPFRVESGRMGAGSTANIYKGFLNEVRKQAGLAKDGKLTAEQLANLERRAGQMQQELWGKATAQAMYGKGAGSRIRGALRNEMAASSFSIGQSVDKIISGAAEANVVEVSDTMMDEMLADASRTAGSERQKAFLETIRSKFYKGENVTGMVGRHGMIGPWSNLPVYLKRAPGNVAETAREKFIRLPSVLQKYEYEIAGAKKTFTADVGPMLGLAGDLDHDIYITKLLTDEKTAGAIDDVLKRGVISEQYNKWVAESSLMTELAKRGSKGMLNLPEVKKLALGAAKLRIAQSETGLISSALSETKLAMHAYKSTDKALRWGMISEILEESMAISSKKMTDVAAQSRAKEVARTLYNLRHGIPEEARRSATNLEAMLKETFGTEVFEKGVKITGPNMSTTLNLNLSEITADLSDAMRKGMGKGGVLHSFRQLQRGKMSPSVEKWLTPESMMEMIKETRSGRGSFMDTVARWAADHEAAGLDASMQAGGNTMARAESAVLTGLNETTRAARGFAGRMWKPALIGLAGTAAAAMLLSRPKRLAVEPPPPATGDARNLATSGMAISGGMMAQSIPREQDLSPESLQQPTLPPAPGMASPPAYVSQQPPVSTRYSIRGSGGPAGMPAVSAVQGMVSGLAPGSQTVTIRDDRQTLTSQKISDLLERP
jgi:hypothetical protein